MSTRKRLRILTVVVAAVILVLVGPACLTAAQTADAVINPPPGWFDDPDNQGSHYFLHTNVDGTSSYLRPESPNLEKTTINNRIRVDNSTKVYFPFAREEWSSLEDKYTDNDKFSPQVSLVVNAGSTAGKVLMCEIWFDFDGLAKTESDVDARAVFKSKTAFDTNTESILKFEYDKTVGQMRDFSEDPDKGNIKLVVWRTDPQEEDMFIYCGAFKAVSWIVVPYSFHRDFVNPDGNTTENGPSAVTIIIALCLMGAIILAIAGYFFYQKSKKDGGGGADDGPVAGGSRSSRRGRKGARGRKSKEFYRKNR